MRRSFKVTLDIPTGATVGDCRDYIYEAVSTWKGQLRPPLSWHDDDLGDPLFQLDADSITVTRIRPTKR